MKNTFEPHDQLDALLAQQCIQPIANDGFSERVMAALPERRATPFGRMLLVGACTIGALLAAWQLSEAEILRTAIGELQQADAGFASTLVLTTLLALGLGLCGWALDEADRL